MTESSIFNFPGFTLLIVVGLPVLITSLFTGHWCDSVHCQIWRGMMSCPVKNLTFSNGASARLDGAPKEETQDTKILGQEVKVPVKILNQAELAIDDLSAKEMHGVLILFPFQDDGKQSRTSLPNVGVRHYFKGVSGNSTNTYVCTDTRVDPSHDSNTYADYAVHSLGIFTLTVEKNHALSGSFGGGETISFYLEPVSIQNDSDQKAWDKLFDNEIH